MTDVKVTVNFSKLEKAAVAAYKETVLLMGRKFTEVISDPGAFAGFDGDMVDTGQFRASQNVNFLKAGDAEFSWNVDYAIYLYMGFTTRSGREVKGRNWVEEAQRRMDFQNTFAMVLKAKMEQP